MKRFVLNIIGIVLMLPLFQGCSTEKNTFASRAYHNVTSKYNVHFNASESLNSSIEKIEERIENDYTRLLPVYKESDPSAANMVQSDMDYVILKASKLIEIHSITEKPKRRKRRTRKYQEFAAKEEFNPWIDDGYLLMGKAYFFQHNFSTAINNFSYVLRKYPEGDAQHESKIWLLRSYSELGRFDEAAEVIKSLQGDTEFPGKLERDLSMATADFYIRQGEYTEAIKFIDIALKKTTWKKQKARLQYIKAQLYEEAGNPDQAGREYAAVLKLNPEYKMAFNARINAFGVLSGTGDGEEMKKELQKMLKDKKNQEFRDQIYYALGNIYFAEGNRDQAIENYRQSVAFSISNQFQRALSAVTLADLYFEDFNYKQAQAYYDSAMIIIDENYPDYAKLHEKYRSLTNLVDNLLTVEREDSLQKIAKMPDIEREALIANLMKEEQERQRNLENLALQGQIGQGYYRSNRYRMGMGRGQQEGGWYFYNPQTVSYGEVTFSQRWGQRKLEDNWRRSNKSTVSMDEMDEVVEAGQEQMEMKEDDPLKKEFYTQDLPLTDSLMALSHDRILEALYNAGKLFKSEFSNYKLAAEAFEDLLKRYPSNIYELSVYFDLYDLYELMGDQQKAAYYRNLIISNYPESKYAQYLLNPNFFVEMEAKTDSLNRLYEEAYSSYRSGNYRNVLRLSSMIKRMKPDSVIIPKIDFMHSIAEGTQTGIQNFENLLKTYLQTYPDKEPSPLAEEILTLIQDSTLADYQKLVEMGYINEEIQNEELLLKDRLENDEFGGKFSYEEDLLHYFVIAYPRDAIVDLNRLKFDIANYNIDHYTKIDFDIETEPLNEDLMLLLVRALDDKESGVIYHRAIIRNAAVFQTLRELNYYNFAISSTNYRQVLSENSLTDYLKFFVKNYSRYIGSDFSDEEPAISPEELMAKAREEDNILRERGEFVVVRTGASELFNNVIDTTQSFVLAVKDPGFSMRTALRDFAEFNRNEYREWNLKTNLTSAGDYQILIVRDIPSLNESMSYFRKVVITRSLFESLGQTTYRNFLITNENLEKVLDEELVEEYIDFFRNNYIGQSQPAKSSDDEPKSGETGITPETENTKQQAPEEYSGPYNSDIEKSHLFVFVIPKEGVDKAAFVDKINQFNQVSGDISGLTVRETPLDEFRDLIIISELSDSESATRYFRMVVQNRDLYSSLGEAEYRNFLITTENFDVFLREKNIADYMDFYKQTYLDK
ncbi:MAG: tetratricopeptide repeat protein [Prolixibacteraceae bacterium]|nr:tetratricopeptide repeat protein [Prolixibacteraceae bacterium]